MTGELLTVRDCAALLKLSTRQIWKLSRSERFPRPFRIGRSVRWRAADVQHFIDAGGDMRRLDYMIPAEVRLERATPCALSEQGAAVLSAMLRWQRADRASNEIVRELIRVRRLLASHGDLKRRLDELERTYDLRLAVVLKSLRELTESSIPKKGQIGFVTRDSP
jgi:predicted DNA-binding transcriptional regulator AlpA